MTAHPLPPSAASGSPFRSAARHARARLASLGGLAALVVPVAAAQQLVLPTRPADALSGTAFAAAVRDLPLDAREDRVRVEIERGNVPSWLRTLAPVTMMRGEHVSVTFWVTPDYLAIGSDDDYLLMPMRPQLAQGLADRAGMSLPTPAMVDAIWAAAPVKLGPDSIAPSAAMITVAVFADHNRMVAARRRADPHPHGTLTAGHKKDVVLTPRLDSLRNRVAIYGWHTPDGRAIQPLNTWHTTGHVDYSHGIRLVARRVVVAGVEHDLVALLRDPDRAALLSDQGMIRHPRYRSEDPPRDD